MNISSMTVSTLRHSGANAFFRIFNFIFEIFFVSFPSVHLRMLEHQVGKKCHMELIFNKFERHIAVLCECVET